MRSEMGRDIIDFCKWKMTEKDNMLSMRELEQYIMSRHPSIAPGSTSRQLRYMRQKGIVDYDVVNKRESKYFIKSVTDV